MSNAAAVLLVALLCTGCSEHALIRSQPPGASVYVNGKFVGITPTEYSVSRSEFAKPLRVRLERSGYRTLEGELLKTIGPGRIAGGVFSFGLSLIFKRPTTLQGSYDYLLVPEPERQAGR